MCKVIQLMKKSITSFSSCFWISLWKPQFFKLSIKSGWKGESLELKRFLWTSTVIRSCSSTNNWIPKTLSTEKDGFLYCKRCNNVEPSFNGPCREKGYLASIEVMPVLYSWTQK
jgi:hypothetical protein